MQIQNQLAVTDLNSELKNVFSLGTDKVQRLHDRWDLSKGTPVFTVSGEYTTRGWTEWTQGFQYGLAILIFDATDNQGMLELGREMTVTHMAPHVSHTGVHDHGFNNLSTYGNLRRLLLENRIQKNALSHTNTAWEQLFYEMALKASSAVQASRWSGVQVTGQENHLPAELLGSGLGYIYSFNGPHSLFVDTMRSCRILNVGWQLGHVLMHENDKRASLLKRSVLHGLSTAEYILFHGTSEHTYDVAGRTAHEAIFNRNDGRFRCRSSQQGYAPFSTWTRGLSWAMLGYAEQLEHLAQIDTDVFQAETGLDKDLVEKCYLQCAKVTCDHYLNDVTASDGIPYWDDGAPALSNIENWQKKPADPFNPHEPVDSSAAAIAAQGLLRLGHYLKIRHQEESSYFNAGLNVARTLMQPPYLSTNTSHEGLLLHSIYHQPNNWDYKPENSPISHSESSMWGDYHLMELAVYLHRLAEDQPYHTFFS